jgi:hypothetical protein
VLVFARRVEHPLDVAVYRSHDADASEHRWPVMFGDEQQRLHCCLPFVGAVLCLGQFSNVFCGVAKRDQWFPTLQYDRVGKLLILRHDQFSRGVS